MGVDEVFKKTFIIQNQPDLFSLDLIETLPEPYACPCCGSSSYYVADPNDSFRRVENFNGPFFRYKRRESELYFDLDKKYFECNNCSYEVSITDIQTLIEAISSRLPPDLSRKFSIKTMRSYLMDPQSARAVVESLLEDFEFAVSNGHLDDFIFMKPSLLNPPTT